MVVYNFYYLMKNYNMFLLFCVSVVILLSSCKAQMQRKDVRATVTELITNVGYPAEKHRAKTDDGYVLQMHRIPAGRRAARRSDGPNAKGKKAVLLVHGLLGHSGDFIIMGPDRSLGFILADAGYDVWLGNLRGNFYSSHQNLTKSDPNFWEYSFHEHGKYDLPALIDKTLNVTGLPKLLYIGYSMGTTSFFTMLATRPEYNGRIIAAVALAPAVYLDNMRPTADLLLRTINVPKTLRERGMLSMNLQPNLLDMVIGNVCNLKQPQQDMCLRIMHAVVGEDYEQADPEITAVILARFQPASWRQLEHFGKIALTGVFTSWEDGLWGKVKPYKLANVRVPVTLLYGNNDKLTEKNQIMRLAAQLNSTGVLEMVRPGSPWPKFNHLDFTFAKDVGKLLNKPLVKHIDRLFNKYAPAIHV